MLRFPTRISTSRFGARHGLPCDPTLLQEETDDLFRRSMKIVLERLDCTLRYPYQHLDGNGQRAAWLTECLESEEIVSPRSFRASGVRGIGQGQMNLDSF